jgi:hypothetical protein
MDYLAAPLTPVSQLLALFAFDAWFHAASDLNKEQGHGVHDGTTAPIVIKTVVSRSAPATSTKLSLPPSPHYRPIWICDRLGSTRSGIDGEGVRGQVQAERRMKARSSTSSPMERP